ncbi:hypothetical protein [Arenibacter sp. S6351L]|uniref:hypothetical protein n=1 Tax=Arenibacter sp. S6351L TaxID=2926407 RepID=UPI001FF2E832|nr:hypothetical protein [Arenibacter sp. S6351L]MCK0137312.1 hypothetical protein [Arenibacter sp. S6351L]
MTVIKDTKYKKALLVELIEVYVSKGHAIQMLVGKDLNDFDRNDLELKLKAEGVDTGIIKSKFK